MKKLYYIIILLIACLLTYCGMSSKKTVTSETTQDSVLVSVDTLFVLEDTVQLVEDSAFILEDSISVLEDSSQMVLDMKPDHEVSSSVSADTEVDTSLSDLAIDAAPNQVVSASMDEDELSDEAEPVDTTSLILNELSADEDKVKVVEVEESIVTEPVIDSVALLAVSDLSTTLVAVVEESPSIAPEVSYDGIAVFSVSETNKVVFSMGNLQYHPVNKTWRFASKQTEYIGRTNKKISAKHNDWIDLFGWGTGATPLKNTTSNLDYATFVEWGTNMADSLNAWRTLTQDEWNYILSTRPSAEQLKGIACVDGVNGLILLPDNWKSPIDTIFNSGFSLRPNAKSYDLYQTITAEQWSQMEEAGAVFLPAAGRRYYFDVDFVQSRGAYWSSSELSDSQVGYLYFDSGVANIEQSNPYYGRSVRLVKEL